MDIESLTVRSVALNQDNELLDPPLLSKERSRKKIEALQVPILFGHADQGPEPRYRVFELSGKETSLALEETCQKYIAHIRTRRDVLEVTKLKLMTPLLEFVRVVENRHEAAFRELAPEKTEKERNNAFKGTIFGRFRLHLLRLSRCYYIAGFNSASYDHILLVSALIRHVRTKKYKRAHARVTKDGNRINSISFPGEGLRFFDSTKLLSPGTSLQSFAKAMNLEISKMAFPFEILRNPDALNLTQLPHDTASWFNHLRQEETPPHIIKEACDAFTRLGCKTVKDFLQHYLEGKTTKKLLLR
jgi:hypothetical protein